MPQEGRSFPILKTSIITLPVSVLWQRLAEMTTISGKRRSHATALDRRQSNLCEDECGAAYPDRRCRPTSFRLKDNQHLARHAVGDRQCLNAHLLRRLQRGLPHGRFFHIRIDEIADTALDGVAELGNIVRLVVDVRLHNAQRRSRRGCRFQKRTRDIEHVRQLRIRRAARDSDFRAACRRRAGIGSQKIVVARCRAAARCVKRACIDIFRQQSPAGIEAIDHQGLGAIVADRREAYLAARAAGEIADHRLLRAGMLAGVVEPVFAGEVCRLRNRLQLVLELLDIGVDGILVRAGFTCRNQLGLDLGQQADDRIHGSRCGIDFRGAEAKRIVDGGKAALVRAHGVRHRPVGRTVTRILDAEAG
ncbi:hypothetical protein RHSP_12029 [Rhizobium freirei PRF 81]|uniref:Uncharacterized protein n=1 Tax=Rhizobium freirei PRF 81 TaxID=363754 RepID=N6UDL4_9HYPH|nr:hypothetical protein RHSP_12029 [Rhizobium freirei PRF 81]